MEEIENTLAILKAVEVVLSMFLIPLTIAIVSILIGIKCLLRNEMLHIYYQYKDEKEIRQFEIENFISLYKAYKALHGNSFITKIYDEVMEWEVIT